jgi:hypothetical protein
VGIVDLISNLVGAVKEFFGFQSKKLDLRNAADVKAAAANQDEAKARDVTSQAIAKKDTDEIRRELAE